MIPSRSALGLAMKEATKLRTGVARFFLLWRPILYLKKLGPLGTQFIFFFGMKLGGLPPRSFII